MGSERRRAGRQGAGPRGDRLLGWATFAGAGVLAVVFAEERTTFTDIAFHLFQYARTGELQIQGHRFVAAVTQWVPLAAMRLGADMATVQLLYSLAFPAWYGLGWAVLHYGLRAHRWACAWALVWVAYALHTHFYIPAEMTQGFVVLLAALALIERRGPDGTEPSWGAVALAAGLLPVAAFAHPTVLAVAVFALGYQLLAGRVALGRAGIAALSFGGTYALRQTVFTTWYDRQADGQLEAGLARLLAGEVPATLTRLLGDAPTAYPLTVALLAAGPGVLLWRGRYALAAWVVACAGGLAGLVVVAYPTPDTTAFYVEHLCFGAALILCVGAAEVLTPWLRRRRRATAWGGALLVAVVALRFVWIGQFGAAVYGERLAGLRAELARQRGRKAVVPETDALRERLLMTWGTPYEAWLLSARAGAPTAGYLVTPSPDLYAEHLGDPELWVGIFVPYAYAGLPGRWFGNPDAAAGYEVAE